MAGRLGFTRKGKLDRQAKGGWWGNLQRQHHPMLFAGEDSIQVEIWSKHRFSVKSIPVVALIFFVGDYPASG